MSFKSSQLELFVQSGNMVSHRMLYLTVPGATAFRRVGYGMHGDQWDRRALVERIAADIHNTISSLLERACTWTDCNVALYDRR